MLSLYGVILPNDWFLLEKEILKVDERDISKCYFCPPKILFRSKYSTRYFQDCLHRIFLERHLCLRKWVLKSVFLWTWKRVWKEVIIDEKAHFQKINGPQSCDKNVRSGNGGVSQKSPSYGCTLMQKSKIKFILQNYGRCTFAHKSNHPLTIWHGQSISLKYLNQNSFKKIKKCEKICPQFWRENSNV